MESRYLIDTNIVIYLLKGRLDPSAFNFMKEVMKQKARVSLITKIELLSFSEEQLLSESFLRDSVVYSISGTITNHCINIRRSYKTKLPDAIIAATCIAHQLTLITRNTADFKKISSLSLINPFNP